MKYSDSQWFVAIIIGWFALIGPGNIIGKYYPAAAPMELVVALPTNLREPEVGRAAYQQGGRRTAIWLSSSRLRPECRFKRIDWYLGKRDSNHVPVKIEVGRPLVRANGNFTAGPWIVHIRLSEFEATYADVFHRCSVLGIELPWLTRSRFWN